MRGRTSAKDDATRVLGKSLVQLWAPHSTGCESTVGVSIGVAIGVSIGVAIGVGVDARASISIGIRIWRRGRGRR